MDAPDIVVPVKQAHVNEYLRYALRSWAVNLPHRRVWIVGHRLPWLVGVGHISTRQTGTKYANTTLAVRAACEHPDISETFLLCNDDFFVMRPVHGGMPVYHRGPVRQVEEHYARRASGKYLRGMRQTRQLLERLGHTEPLSYELHVPLPVDKAGMLRALEAGRGLDVLHKRTLYGNLVGLDGEFIRDVKVLTRGPRFDQDAQFLSTMPQTFTSGAVGHLIRRAFPAPSPYERGAVRRRAAAHRPV